MGKAPWRIMDLNKTSFGRLEKKDVIIAPFSQVDRYEAQQPEVS